MFYFGINRSTKFPMLLFITDFIKQNVGQIFVLDSTGSIFKHDGEIVVYLWNQDAVNNSIVLIKKKK